VSLADLGAVAFVADEACGHDILPHGDEVKATRAVSVLLLTLLLGLPGCFLFDSAEPTLTAVIGPVQGHVPYSAQIVATAPPGTFTFTLPNTTIVQDSGVLEVLVDSITWSATVTWTDGSSLKTTTVTATGSNARPTINRPLINGVTSQWFLKPREQTLIDFSYRPASMTSPTTGVHYDEEWSIHEIVVMCSEKLLCNQRIRDSIYCPPYETGVYHAIFKGALHENACIVYPTSTYEPSTNGIPYAPVPEEGYTYDTVQNRSVFKRVVFPAQTAIIRVVVRDHFGRMTSKEFEIPVLALSYTQLPTSYEPKASSGDLFSDAQYFVASKDETVFHQSWCYRACLIPEASRVYYADSRHAEESGRTLGPICLVGQPGPCACTGIKLNCEDFDSQADAQACFEYCRSMEYGDIHGLDSDNDGVACEDLP